MYISLLRYSYVFNVYIIILSREGNPSTDPIANSTPFMKCCIHSLLCIFIHVAIYSINSCYLLAPIFRPGIELDDIVANRGAQEAEYEDLDMYRGDYSHRIATYDDVHYPPSPPATLRPIVSPTCSPPAEYACVQQRITKCSGGVKELDYTQCAAYATSRPAQTDESSQYANDVLSADLESSVQDENNL